MDTARLVDHQIKVEVTQIAGILTIRLPDGTLVQWPIQDASVASGPMYLTLSPRPALPDKAALARQVLKEILQINQ